jgi:pyruvate dehydrogenase complex dehydrogenase (E1) component
MAMEAAERLAKEGISVDLLAVATVKPIDAAALAASAAKTGAVLSVEEHNVIGGFGGAVAEALAKHAPTRMDFIGVQDRFTESGPYDALMKKYGISVEAIVAKAKALVAAKAAVRKSAPAVAPVRKAAAKTAVKRKAVAKKSVAKKTVATKPAAKKVAAKKVVRKKAVAKRSVRKTR